ncbi:hypothetical protein GCM10029978_111930 [Actinoallomurus acanthiterrae]
MRSPADEGTGRGPLLAVPYEGADGLVRGLRADLATLGYFRPEANMLDAVETAQAAEVAVAVRKAVLLRVYAGDYHTDSFDVGHLAEQVRSGDEAIWFYGGDKEVARLREVMAASPDDLPELDLGTVSVLCAETEFGPGIGELCRSGSMDRSLGAKAPIMWRTLLYHTGAEPTLSNRYHTLMLVARNRPTTPDVRGGEALQRIHSRYVRSRFWGYLPFYVMQGGVLEQLEYRESNRDPDDVLRALEDSPPWHFADPVEGEFAAALAEVSLGRRPRIVCDGPGPAEAEKRARYRLLMPRTAELAATNHAVVQPAGAGDPSALALGAAVRRARDGGVCCVAVQLDVTDADTVPVQRRLSEQGFRLSAVIPPKKSWLVADGRRRDVEVRPKGIWVLPREDLRILGPYYRDYPAWSEAEGKVLGYLRDRLTREAVS